MCGRFTLTWEEWRQILESLGIEDESHTFADYRPRFNIAPTDRRFAPSLQSSTLVPRASGSRSGFTRGTGA